jgi:hypothetical protein
MLREIGGAIRTFIAARGDIAVLRVGIAMLTTA